MQYSLNYAGAKFLSTKNYGDSTHAVILWRYYPTLKLSGIPTFTYRLDNI